MTKAASILNPKVIIITFCAGNEEIAHKGEAPDDTRSAVLKGLPTSPCGVRAEKALVQKANWLEPAKKEEVYLYNKMDKMFP
jgi:hypothetical protein